ncbi:ABC transporter ATP-binding protein [Rhizobium sp. S95]|uniref:ABC transporter ATP-binding protein n=1 Tax=Ciceribacter sichuanensis TaxID=2949647 RepID=A0AAJ1BZ63_9HYPH|nr:MULTISPECIES: ABC transporter ATP-binding protein [unclassified Ciceribacter]MCM2397360.1 ABC transporter ATP-binding protein [Ciceribacter sp. S95]MCO5958990.1 ABC transporter ATP-binding protein [Ciceribacter sp. S101]
MSVPKLQIVNLRKEFSDGSVAAVDGIDLEVAAGETVALLGSSGCGKSTTLNMVVGLENPTSGDILIDGKSVIGLPPGKRNVGLVFQDYAVFTSMSVRQNLAFGLKVRGVAKAEIARAVDEVAELLGMTGKLDARARDLGGSELQRVAIGRTLVTKPDILLLDEPLSNLEAAARLAMRKELRRLQKEAGLTIIYVTHDQIEALSLADRIAVMSAGKIKQVEKASLICQEPGHLFVANFMGSPPMNLIRGWLSRDAGQISFMRDDFSVSLPAETVLPEKERNGPVVLGIRPETVRLARPGPDTFEVAVRAVEPRGAEAVLTLEHASQTLKAVVPAQERPLEGAVVNVAVDPQTFVLFSGETDLRLPLRAGDAA